MIDRFHTAIAAVTVIGSTAFLLALMVIRAEERKETVGILRLIGISRQSILIEVIIEGLLVAVAGAVVGVAIAMVAQHGVNLIFQARYDTTLVFVRVTPSIALRSRGGRRPRWRDRRRGGFVDAAAPQRGGARQAMTAFALAWRTARRYRARAVLAVVGVAVIGALNFDMLLLSHGLLLSFADLINSTGFDVRVVGSAGLPLARLPVDDAGSLMAEISRLPEVERAALVRSEPAMTTMSNQPGLPLELVGTTDPAGAGSWTLVSGENLGEVTDTASSSPPPIVVAQSLASRLDLQPGSILRLRVRIAGAMSALPSVEFRVAGVANFPVRSGRRLHGRDDAGPDFQLANGGAAPDEADMVLAASAPAAGPDAAVAAIARLRPDLRVFSNDEVISTFNRNGFAYFRQISIVLSTTTAVFTFLLVATLLTVSVNQRLGEVAALRALGIARRKIAATLLWEAALLVGVGGVLALPLGAAARRAARSDSPPDAGAARRPALLRVRAAGAVAACGAACGDGGRGGALSDVAGREAAHRADAEAGGCVVTVVEARGLTRTFAMQAGPVTAVRDVSLRVEAGDYVAIGGPSGCGKSTLLHLLGCVDTPSAGSVWFEGRDVGVLRRQRARPDSADAHRVRLSAFLPAADADRVGKHRVAAGGSRRRVFRAARAHACAARVRGARRPRRSSAVGTVGRRNAARRGRQGAGQPAGAAAGRRADRRARRGNRRAHRGAVRSRARRRHRDRAGDPQRGAGRPRQHAPDDAKRGIE